MKAALILAAALFAAAAGAQEHVPPNGGIAPPALTCAATPSAATPFALIEWPVDRFYDGAQRPPAPLGLRWCSAPGDERSERFSPAPWTRCASENATCTPPRYPVAVLYTTGNPSAATNPPMQTWSRPIKVISAPIACTNGAFGGDPRYMVVKSCWIRPFQLEAAQFTDGPLPGRGYQVGRYFFVR